MKILLLANSGFKLANFRAGLIQTLISEGHELVGAVPHDDHKSRLEAIGVRVIDLPMDATGTSLLHEADLLWRILDLTRRERPDAIFGYTIKPNIYGALCARILGIPFIPNVTGLGSVFDDNNFLAGTVKRLYRTAFRRCPRVFLQNPEDLEMFVCGGLARREQVELLPGSGVDLNNFAHAPLPGRETQVTFLLVARMLRDKGVEIFAEAAELLHRRFPQVAFQLLGPYGTGKASGLNEADIARLTESGAIIYLGEADDVRPFLTAADCVVLPSFYREGTPRSLLEASAMGRPVITTDMPGCRDTVKSEISGYLCVARDTQSIADAMENFILLSDIDRQVMGMAARSHMVEYFDEQLVIDSYRQALKLCVKA